MPKIIPLKLNENRPDSLIEFLEELCKKHTGQQKEYVRPLIRILEEFTQKGPTINKDHKNFILLKNLKEINIMVYVKLGLKSADI